MKPTIYHTVTRKRRMAAEALAADMRELESSTGAATEADLIARGWDAKRLTSLAPAARELLKEPHHG